MSKSLNSRLRELAERQLGKDEARRVMDHVNRQSRSKESAREYVNSTKRRFYRKTGLHDNDLGLEVSDKIIADLTEDDIFELAKLKNPETSFTSEELRRILKGHEYVKGSEENRKEWEAQQKKYQKKQEDYQGPLEKAFKTVIGQGTIGGQLWNNVLDEDDRQAIKNSSPVEAAGDSLGWTLDQISRPIHGFMSATEAGIDANEGNEDSILEKVLKYNPVTGPAMWAPEVIMGGNPLIDAIQGVTSNPGSIKDILEAGKEGFFLENRATGSDIIKKYADDGKENWRDNQVWQAGTGLALDLGYDPLNYIGVGALRRTAEIARNGPKGMSADNFDRSVKELISAKLPRQSFVEEGVLPAARRTTLTRDDLNALLGKDGNIPAEALDRHLDELNRLVTRKYTDGKGTIVSQPSTASKKLLEQATALRERINAITNGAGADVLADEVVDTIPRVGDETSNDAFNRIYGSNDFYQALRSQRDYDSNISTWDETRRKKASPYPKESRYQDYYLAETSAGRTPLKITEWSKRFKNYDEALGPEWSAFRDSLKSKQRKELDSLLPNTKADLRKGRGFAGERYSRLETAKKELTEQINAKQRYLDKDYKGSLPDSEAMSTDGVKQQLKTLRERRNRIVNIQDSILSQNLAARFASLKQKFDGDIEFTNPERAEALKTFRDTVAKRLSDAEARGPAAGGRAGQPRETADLIDRNSENVSEALDEEEFLSEGGSVGRGDDDLAVLDSLPDDLTEALNPPEGVFSDLAYYEDLIRLTDQELNKLRTPVGELRDNGIPTFLQDESGQLDRDALGETLGYDEKKRRVFIHKSRMGRDYTPEERAFLDKVRDEVNTRVREYVKPAVKTDKIKPVTPKSGVDTKTHIASKGKEYHSTQADVEPEVPETDNLATALKNATATVKSEDAINEDIVDQALEEVFNDLSTGTMGKDRLTPVGTTKELRESVAEGKRVFNENAKMERAEAREAIKAASTPDELANAKAELAAVEKDIVRRRKRLDKAAGKAFEAKKAELRNIREQHWIDIVTRNSERIHTTEKGYGLRLMGKTLALPGSYSAVKKISEFTDQNVLTKAFKDAYRELFEPPANTLSLEGQLQRARATNNLPNVISNNLDYLYKNMAHLSKRERATHLWEAMNKRNPTDANSKIMAQTFDDLLPYFQGKYKFNNGESLRWHEITKFMPEEYMDGTKLELSNFRNRESFIKAFSGSKSGNLNVAGDAVHDPLDLAWHTRIAVEQAIAYKAIREHAKEAFGIPNGIRNLGYSRDSDDYLASTDALRSLKSNGWRPVKDVGDDTLFPPEVATDMERLFKMLEPRNIAPVMRNLDRITRAWKAAVTVPNPGYYTRNYLGEVLTGFLGGVTNPKYYKDATRLVRVMNREKDQIDALKSQEPWAAYLKSDAPTGGRTAVKLRNGQKITDQEAIILANDQGILSGFINEEFNQRVGMNPWKTNVAARTGRKGWESMRKFGETVEAQPRLAHFLHAMENAPKNLKSIEDIAQYAAGEVRKYHFDYTNVTNFEKATMLRAFPFYKWTRMALPLMLGQLALNPSKVNAVPKSLAAMSEATGNEESVDGYKAIYADTVPEYIQDMFGYRTDDNESGDPDLYTAIATPQIDALKFLENPGEGALGLSNPVGMLPLNIINGERVGDPFNREGHYIFNDEGPQLGRILQDMSSYTPVTKAGGRALGGDMDAERWTAFLTGLGLYKDYNTAYHEKYQD